MILAADFGCSTIKLGPVNNGSIIARSRLEACAERPMSERLEAVACEWESLLKQSITELRDCERVTLTLPFLVDPKSQRVLEEMDPKIRTVI